MKAVLMFVAFVFASVVYATEPKGVPMVPPPPYEKFETRMTKKVWEESMRQCLAQLELVKPGAADRYRKQRYCRCFVREMESVYPRGAPKEPTQKDMARAAVWVAKCYARYFGSPKPPERKERP